MTYLLSDLDQNAEFARRRGRKRRQALVGRTTAGRIARGAGAAAVLGGGAYLLSRRKRGGGSSSGGMTTAVVKGMRRAAGGVRANTTRLMNDLPLR